jgi:hypothetical protein
VPEKQCAEAATTANIKKTLSNLAVLLETPKQTRLQEGYFYTSKGQGRSKVGKVAVRPAEPRCNNTSKRAR